MNKADQYPVAIFEDRYSGTYSGGPWIAVAWAALMVDANNTRAQFCLIGDDGPSGGDVEAAAFWRNPPDWVAVGSSPLEAVRILRNRSDFSLS